MGPVEVPNFTSCKLSPANQKPEFYWELVTNWFYRIYKHMYVLALCLCFLASFSWKHTWTNAIYQFLVFAIWLSLLGSFFCSSFCKLLVSSTKAKMGNWASLSLLYACHAVSMTLLEIYHGNKSRSYIHNEKLTTLFSVMILWVIIGRTCIGVTFMS